MNNTFNFKRFGKYLAYDLKSVWEEQRVFLLTYALIPVITYIVIVFFALVGHGFSMDFSDYTLARPSIAVRVSVFSLVSVIFLIFFPSRTYGFITDKAKGSAWIQLPASRLEKFSSMMLICLVIIPVAFFCAYLISDALVCLVDKNCGSSIFSSWNSLDMTSYDEDGKSFKIAGKGIFVINTDGTALKRICAGARPAWMPDGKALVVTRLEDNGHTFTAGDLYYVSTENSAQLNITPGTQAIPTSLAVSPDGKKVAFGNDVDGCIYLIDLKF